MQAPQTSAEAADTAARVALAAAHAGLGPAQQAQEEARTARLRHIIVEDMPGGLGGSGRPVGGLSSPSGPESSENSFSRYCIILASRMMLYAQERDNCAAPTRLCAVSWFSCTSIGHPCLYFILQARLVAEHGLSMGMPVWSHWRFDIIATLPSGAAEAPWKCLT